MNKLFKRGLALMMGILAATGVFAQEMPQIPPMPVDSAVRVGTLPNGLTYYIRHNETPKGQAEFFIAQKVGSVLEEDNQRGLAHFLEHMCFNGTKNFPGKGIINYLESIGVKFGYNLNAYTGTDETVYNISAVPTARQGVQDSCLLILHDWANALTLDPAEIDAERGVIHEEWRRSMAGEMRVIEELLPKIYPDSKYGHRLPIGIMEVVDNFPPQAIVDYYHTWYRPDNQAIIVVGDIDPNYIEGKIKELFSPIKMPENAKPRVYEPVGDTPGTIVAIGKDKEVSAANITLMFKTDKMLPRELNNTQAHYAVNYMVRVVDMMLNNRLSDLAAKPACPYANASVSIGNFFLANTKDALMLDVTGKQGDIIPALQAAYREILRASRGGFTVGEFERANAEIRSQYQKLYDSRNNTPSNSYAREYVRAYVDNEPIPGIELEKQIMDAMTQSIPLQAINQFLPELIKPDNRVVMVMMPDSESFTVPTEEGVLNGIAEIEAENIEPYKDTMKAEPLIPNLPAPGKIVSETHNAQWDATEFTLSNGVKVIVKPTTFKDNEIKFNAIAKGGFSVRPDADASSIIFMPYAMSKYGLGDYNNSDMNKYLQGKQVAVSVNLSSDTRDVTGNSTIQDLPTLMELIYATFTEYNISAEDFAGAQNMYKGLIANQESTPQFTFSKLLLKTLFSAPACQNISTAAIEQANRDVTVNIIRQMLANPTQFTFTFVGNIDLEKFKPLMEQYIATLPVGESVALELKPGFQTVKGAKETVESMKMETPQTWAFYFISGDMPYTPKNKAISSMVAQVMSKRLLDKVREEMGATYSIGANGSMSRIGDSNTGYQIAFPMKPEMKNEVFAAIDTILNEVGTNITDEELKPIKEFMVKEAIADKEENSDWCSAITATTLNGVDTFNGSVDVINSITVKDLMDFWNAVKAQGNKQLVILNPAE